MTSSHDPGSQRLGLSFDQIGVLDLPGVRRYTPAALDLPPCDHLEPEVLAVARRGWEDRLRSEYVGVMVMRKFHGLLVDLNAPMDLQEVALILTLQEQSHTRLCADIADHLGSDNHLGFELEELQQERSGEPLDEQLWSMLLGTFICGEGVAFELLKFCLKRLPKTPYTEALRAIARDEVLHATLGLKLLDKLRRHPSAWIDYPGDAWVTKRLRAQLTAMRGRDVVEHDEARFFEVPGAATELEALGIPDSRAFVRCYHEAIDDAIPSQLATLGIDLNQGS